MPLITETYLEGLDACIVFIKTRTKYASKDGIELAVLKALREVLLEILSFVFEVTCLLMVLLVDEFSLVHPMIYGAHKQTHNKEKEIKILSLSSNQRKLKYGDMNNIFWWFSSGTARIILGMAWSSFGIIGEFLVHGMIG